MDIVLVSYNSEKWMAPCLESINKTNPIDEKINIFIVDNHSTDHSVEVAKGMTFREGVSLKVLPQKDNLGFGRANNAGARAGKDDILLFINIDTEMYPETMTELVREIKESDPKVGAWELRQIPYEHCKYYNPVTREASWISGAAFAVRRELYEKIGGFDPKIFMYGEDVDISWRMRAEGYTLKYCPKVRINHYAYTKANEVKPTQYIESIINNLCLRYRYATIKQILHGHSLFRIVMKYHGEPFEGAKVRLKKRYHEHFRDFPYYFFKTRVKDKTIGQFLEWDYENVRKGPFVPYKEPEKKEMVSVILETAGDLSALRDTLITLENQTYRNFEVVVLEKGADVSSALLKEFGDLSFQYHLLSEDSTEADLLNYGMKQAKGSYLNILREGDLLYGDHLETILAAMEDANRGETPCFATYSFVFEAKWRKQNGASLELVERKEPFAQEYDRELLKTENYLRMPGLVFARSLYEKAGGFEAADGDAMEWKLWLRFLAYTDYVCVPKTTAEYKTFL